MEDPKDTLVRYLQRILPLVDAREMLARNVIRRLHEHVAAVQDEPLRFARERRRAKPETDGAGIAR